MTPTLVLVIVAALLFGSGVAVMLERSLTRVLIGFLLVGNGVNLFMFAMAGAPGVSPVLVDGVDVAELSDPLPQAFVLTAIVINLGLTAFMLALVYRTWWLARLGAQGDIIGDEEDVEEDAEEAAGIMRSAADDDRAVQEVLDASDEEVRR